MLRADRRRGGIEGASIAGARAVIVVVRVPFRSLTSRVAAQGGAVGVASNQRASTRARCGHVENVVIRRNCTQSVKKIAYVMTRGRISGLRRLIADDRLMEHSQGLGLEQHWN